MAYDAALAQRVLVAGHGLTDQELQRWIVRARGYVGTLPPT